MCVLECECECDRAASNLDQRHGDKLPVIYTPSTCKERHRRRLTAIPSISPPYIHTCMHTFPNVFLQQPFAHESALANVAHELRLVSLLQQPQAQQVISQAIQEVGHAGVQENEAAHIRLPPTMTDVSPRFCTRTGSPTWPDAPRSPIL